MSASQRNAEADRVAVERIDEAVEWAQRSPMSSACEIEIRPLWEPEDFGSAAEGESENEVPGTT